MTDKLTKAERERIIFDFLKGKPNPLYEVSETKYGKYIVKPKVIQLEEEEQHETPEEPEEEEEEEPQVKQMNVPPPSMKPLIDKAEAKRERRRRNRRAKQDAKRILDALTNLINANDESSDELDDETQRAPPLVEQPNIRPVQQLSFRRRRLAF